MCHCAVRTTKTSCRILTRTLTPVPRGINECFPLSYRRQVAAMLPSINLRDNTFAVPNQSSFPVWQNIIYHSYKHFISRALYCTGFEIIATNKRGLNYLVGKLLLDYCKSLHWTYYNTIKFKSTKLCESTSDSLRPATEIYE